MPTPTSATDTVPHPPSAEEPSKNRTYLSETRPGPTGDSPEVAAIPETDEAPAASRRGLAAYLVVALCCGAFLVVLGSLGWRDPINHGVVFTEWNSHYNDADQYALLADSLLHGRLDLDLPVPEELLELENPYDQEARYALGSRDIPIYWDHAFHDGRYYSYFGVVPALALYAPYQLLTGAYLDTVAAVVVLALAALAATALLVWRVRGRWFPDAGGLAVCLALLAFFLGEGVVYLVSVPRFYSVPLLAGIACLCLGLWFWFGARVPVRGSHGAGPATELRTSRVLVGSIFLALVLGCRPQLCIAWLLAFPLFWDDVFRYRTLFSTRSVAQSFAALAPFAVVGAAIAWYNWARFGSPLDFGAYYNLTGHDMNAYEQVPALVRIEMALMFLAPFKFAPTAPYLAASDDYFDIVGGYDLGWAPSEPLFGGYLWSVPTTLLVLATPFAWRRLWRKGVAVFVPILVAASLVVCYFDVNNAGVSQRYLADFGWALSLSAVLVFLAFAEGRGPLATVFKVVFCAFVAAGVFFCLWGLISPDHWDGLWGVVQPLFADMGLA